MGHIRRSCHHFKRRVGQSYSHKAKFVEDSSDTDGAFAASVGSLQKSFSARWLVDSGASSHMTRRKDLLMNYVEFAKPEKVALGDGKTVEAMGKGNVPLQMLFEENDSQHAVLYDVLYVPKLTCNLFSVKSAVAKSNSEIWQKSVLDSKC